MKEKLNYGEHYPEGMGNPVTDWLARIMFALFGIVGVVIIGVIAFIIAFRFTPTGVGKTTQQWVAGTSF